MRRSILVRSLYNILFFVFIVLIHGGCKKDHSILGVDVQPSEDFLSAGTVTNYPVYAHTIAYDSVISFTKFDRDNIKYLGSNIDPHFGRQDVGLYLNSTMSLANLDFGSSAVLSSAEIVLVVNNTDISGDPNASLTYSVYPLDSSLIPSRPYYTSNKRLHNKSQLLASHTTSYTTLNSKLVIRIPIDANYATTILKNPQYLVSNETYQANYKGFYITASSNGAEGIIYQCDVEDDVSGFYLHYKAGSAATDTIQDFRFAFSGPGSTKFNTTAFAATSPLQNQLAGDTTLGATNMYLKGMGDTRLKMQIPFLKKYSDTFNIAVNRAEVIFNMDQSFTTSGIYRMPAKLSLLAIDSLGRESYTTDQLKTTYISRYDGVYDELKHRYVFNIALHAQEVFKGARKNHGFYLVLADPLPPYTLRRDNSIARVILEGSNKSLRPVFNLSYTRFNNQ